MSGFYLATSLRKQLAKTIDQARKVAEAAAAEAIRRLGVAEAKAPGHLDEGGKRLRNALRAHARVLGDKREPSGEQAVAKLKEATAYEHWHRMLFARYLAERGLLIHPGYRAPVSLEDCKDLAAEEGLPDAWAVAERYATRMLPGIFRPDDPSLALTLAPEDAAALRGRVLGLEPAVFAAADSLGWTYQFWRAAEKDAVNKAGGKIGADELPAVTQLFTEPYMVQFLLHNTLGAWWAGKRLASEPQLARIAADEPALRKAMSLPGIDWAYLRFVQEDGVWRPAAGTFPGWPEHAAEITVMDPCCGSGHFLVEALGILAALRIAEEGLAPADAVSAVLRDNLFGLEIDGRCVQIAAFAVALVAWRIVGNVIELPRPHIAWVGQAPAVSKSEWLRLTEAIAADGPVPPKRDLLGTEENLFSMPDRWALEVLWGLMEQAPVLGSLLDMGAAPPLFAERLAGFEADLAKAAFGESDADELALAARGMADAAAMLVRRYTLQATNVPFRTSGTLSDAVSAYLEKALSRGRRNLSTAMMERLTYLVHTGGTLACVTPKEWLSSKSYESLRKHFLNEHDMLLFAGLGPHAFRSISGEVVNGVLVICSPFPSSVSNHLQYLDVTVLDSPSKKESAISSVVIRRMEKSSILSKKGAEIVPNDGMIHLLSEYVYHHQGLATGDLQRFSVFFWELKVILPFWVYWQGSVKQTGSFSGRERVLRWEHGRGQLHQFNEENKAVRKNTHLRGIHLLGKSGALVTQMGALPVTRFAGERFDDTTTALIPKKVEFDLPVWAFVSSAAYGRLVREIDSSIKVPAATQTKVSFDLGHWQQITAELYPNGLPEPYSDDPTQWLFHGHPVKTESGAALHVALARIAGYRWPAEADMEMRLSADARNWIAKAATLTAADADGILCIPPVGGEASLGERLRAALTAAFGSAWNAATEGRLLAEAAERFNEKPAADIEDWLRQRFFGQHCVLFHQRPFLWHVWDGQRDGFAVVLDYHRLTKAALQKLTYTVLGDWLARMKDLGDTRRLEAARILQQKLELILVGENPLDIFVRWKSREHLPLGWDPDLGDGVRQNIRPFIKAEVLAHDLSKILKTKDRGADMPSAPWYHLFEGERINDHHTTLAEKQAARDAARKAS